MKIHKAFSLDLGILKTLKVLQDKLGFATETRTIEKCIEKVAQIYGIKIYTQCAYFGGFRKGQVYCNKIGMFVQYSKCLKCEEWKE